MIDTLIWLTLLCVSSIGNGGGGVVVWVTDQTLEFISKDCPFDRIALLNSS